MRVRRGVVFTAPVGDKESPLPVNETSVTKMIKIDSSSQLDDFHQGSEDAYQEEDELEVEVEYHFQTVFGFIRSVPSLDLEES